MYLKARGIAIDCLRHPERPAVLDSLHLARVNQELYFFSDLGSVRQFRRDPLKLCGLVTDPVTRERFRPTKKSPRTEWRGTPFYFASEANRRTFAAMPDSFAVRRGM
jgi:YHS domain-containing protein